MIDNSFQLRGCSPRGAGSKLLIDGVVAETSSIQTIACPLAIYDKLRMTWEIGGSPTQIDVCHMMIGVRAKAIGGEIEISIYGKI